MNKSGLRLEYYCSKIREKSITTSHPNFSRIFFQLNVLEAQDSFSKVLGMSNRNEPDLFNWYSELEKFQF